MGYKEGCEILRKAAFIEAEKHRLSKLRRDLAEEGRYQELVELRRLQFVRWLVATGKLTERVVLTKGVEQMWLKLYLAIL